MSNRNVFELSKCQKASCSQVFIPVRWGQVFCSKECRFSDYNERRRQERQQRQKRQVRSLRITSDTDLSDVKPFQDASLEEASFHHHMPKTYGECPKTGPCPWVRCRHHRYLDVDPKSGALRLNFPKLDVMELDEPCTLRLAERAAKQDRLESEDVSGFSFEEIGGLLNCNAEAVRQTVIHGLKKVQRRNPELAGAVLTGAAVYETARQVLHKAPAPKAETISVPSEADALLASLRASMVAATTKCAELERNAEDLAVVLGVSRPAPVPTAVPVPVVAPRPVLELRSPEPPGRRIPAVYTARAAVLDAALLEAADAALAKLRRGQARPSDPRQLSLCFSPALPVQAGKMPTTALPPQEEAPRARARAHPPAPPAALSGATQLASSSMPPVGGLVSINLFGGQGPPRELGRLLP